LIRRKANRSEDAAGEFPPPSRHHPADRLHPHAEIDLRETKAIERSVEVARVPPVDEHVQQAVRHEPRKGSAERLREKVLELARRHFTGRLRKLVETMGVTRPDMP